MAELSVKLGALIIVVMKFRPEGILGHDEIEDAFGRLMGRLRPRRDSIVEGS